jgi:hypothetical protein
MRLHGADIRHMTLAQYRYFRDVGLAGQLPAAVAALHHDSTLLRQELDHRGQIVGLSSRA